MMYWVGTITYRFSAVWSNSAVRFGRLVVYFWPSGFYLFGRLDSAVWARLSFWSYGFLFIQSSVFFIYFIIRFRSSDPVSLHPSSNIYNRTIFQASVASNKQAIFRNLKRFSKFPQEPKNKLWRHFKEQNFFKILNGYSVFVQKYQSSKNWVISNSI